MYTKNRINRIYLMLGTACNFNCRYCIQSGEFQSHKHQFKQEVNSDLYNYIKSIQKERESHKINLMYWGGEPLLYMDTIKQIVPEFPDARHTIVSNGSLLTQEIVDYLNEHLINYVVSNDGPLTEKTRLVNILEDEKFLKLFRQIKVRGVDSVISAYCQDYQLLSQYIVDKCGFETLQNSEFLLPSVVMPEDAYAFDYEAYRKSLRKVFDKGIQDILSGNFSHEFMSTSSDLRQIDNIERATIPRCSQMKGCINLDLQGNIYVCHNSSVKIGTIYDDDAKLDARYQQYLEHQQIITKKGCAGCEAYTICRGGCPIIEPEAHGQEACCHLRRVYVQELKEAHKRISEKILDSIGPDVKDLDDAVRMIHKRYEEGVDMIDGSKR